VICADILILHFDIYFFFFFFFQAEDGIRDRNVTGVQTCALPISRRFNPQNASAHQISVLLSTISNSSSSLGSHRQVLYSAGQFPRSLSETQVCRPHRRKFLHKCTPTDHLPAPECAAHRLIGFRFQRPVWCAPDNRKSATAKRSVR